MTAAEYAALREEDYRIALEERFGRHVPSWEMRAKPLPMPPRYVPRRRRATGQPVDAQIGRAA